MARVRKYKKVEKNIVVKIISKISSFFKVIGKAFKKFFEFGCRKITVMIVPHSEKKPINFQTSIFAIASGFIIVFALFFSFIFFNTKSSRSTNEIARLTEENRKIQANLDELRDENSSLLLAAKRFQGSLTKSLDIVGIDQVVGTSQDDFSNGDLSSLFDMQELSEGSLRESADIKQLTSYLDNSVQPLEQIAKMLESQGTLFSDIPSVWPLKGGIGHVSMAFGQNEHPITKQWYIHKGMDFSTWRSGDPIIATANGQVVTVMYDNGFGNSIIIKHKHGFYTRYAHLNSIRVKKGQYVSQGEVIGTLGNTGLSTGPHLHYEVHIGSDVVDPAKYVNVKLSK
ncbi:MAG: M23 family metallopeptidase [Treponemataceae bacterium]|nr:M23 family metallopeptidase [Treponemataceae bacterium]